MTAIKFYRTGDPYGCLSNFSPHPFVLDREHWATSEHYFQAKKFEGTEFEAQIREAKSPMIAARMGRDRSLPLRPDWEQVKLDVMRAAIRAKFEQNIHAKVILLGTKGIELIEHTSNDAFWGDGGDGTGKNMLGVLLMELRDLLEHTD